MEAGLPETEISVALAQKEEGSSVFGDVPNSSAGVDFPLAEVAEFCLDDHG